MRDEAQVPNMRGMGLLLKKQLHLITFSSRANRESFSLRDAFNFTCRLSTFIALAVGRGWLYLLPSLKFDHLSRSTSS